MEASIIIPTLNRSQQLSRTIKSLVDLEFEKGMYEIIVIDNGSTDNTKQIVENYILKYYKNTIRYIYDNTPGLLTGRHRGAIEASSQILIYIDDDISVAKIWLTEILKTFDSRPEVHLVGGKCLPNYESTPPAWLDYFWNYLPNDGKMLTELSLCDYGEKKMLVDPLWVFGLNFSIRKSTLNELGGFHPDSMPSSLQYFQGDGESGLAIKLKERGYKALYNPNVIVYHEVPTSRMTVEYFDKRYFFIGVSGSYNDIRRNGGRRQYLNLLKQISYLYDRLLGISLPRINRLSKKTNFEEIMLKNRFKSMSRAGYEFHQTMTYKYPEILNWVLKKDYLNYKLPKIETVNS